MREIFLFENQIQLQKFLFFCENPLNYQCFLLDDFLIFNLDDLEKEYRQNFQYKSFKRIDFDFCFYQMLDFLSVDNPDYLEIFYSQKKYIKKIFDLFWLSVFFESKNFFEDLRLNFSNFNFEDEFLQICEKIFLKLKDFFSEQSLIYQKFFEFQLLKFYQKCLNFENFQGFIKNFETKFKKLNYSKSLEKFFNEKLIDSYKADLSLAL